MQKLKRSGTRKMKSGCECIEINGELRIEKTIINFTGKKNDLEFYDGTAWIRFGTKIL